MSYSFDSTINDSTTPWSDLPVHILQAELRRRQDEGIPAKPECGTKGNRAEYNTPAHVFALILILTLSTLACSFPIIARRFPKLPIPHRFLFLSRHFGTGVLIATAFVHLLPTAFVSLTDPCLPDFWNQGYPAMAGLIAMTSMLVVVGIEMFFATRGAGHIHGSEYDTIANEENGHMGHTPRRQRSSTSLRRFRQEPVGQSAVPNGTLGPASASQQAWSKVPQASPPASPLPPDPHTVSPLPDTDSEFDQDLETSEFEVSDNPSPTSTLLTPHPSRSHQRSSKHAHFPHSEDPQPLTHDPAQERKLLLQVLLLEAGILFHSIFIGIAVSVSTGPPFVVLLIAISFHQTFEGFALGARIASIPTLNPTSLRPWLMALAYGTTTPIGQAIGLAVHGLYDPQGQMGLLMVGSMNAISSGLLLFAGLVELLAEDFLSERSYESLRGRRRLEACGAVVGGAFLMALVGAWA